MADAKIRQSMKSLSILLSLKAVRRSVLLSIGIIVIVSLWTITLIPVATLSGESVPAAMYLVPFAESSKMLMSLA